MTDLYDRLTTYLDLLGSRPDVHVHRRTAGPPGALAAYDASQLPNSVADFVRRGDGLAFWWVFADERADVDEYRAGYNGGWLNLRSLTRGGAGWTTQSSDDAPELAGHSHPVLLLDDLHVGARAYLSASHQGRTADSLVWYLDSDQNEITAGDFQDYLREGARHAFALDWQRASRDEEPHATTVRTRLLARSVSQSSDRATLDAALRARGTSPAMAAALLDWIGEDVALLLPRSTLTSS